MLSFAAGQAGGLLASLLAVALVALRAAVPDPTHRAELRNAIALFVASAASYAGAQVLEVASFQDAARYVRSASYLFFVFGGVRAATSLAVWLLRTRRGKVTPRILRDVVDALLYLVGVTIVLRATLQVDLGGLLATSAILSVVIGFALQETLGNLCAGLSLQIDPPFGVGDWIRVGAHSGKVLQIAWRQTRIVTPRNEEVTLPNSVVAKEQVVNFSRASNGVARDLYVEVDYDSPPNTVKRTCLEVLASHPKVRSCPPPIFRVSAWQASGVQYQVRFFTDHFEDTETVADEVLSLLWYRLRREGFSIPFPTRTVHIQNTAGGALREAEHKDIAPLLASVDFLRPLDAGSGARLAALAKIELFGKGETIIRQGESGETFYLIISGEVAVRAASVPGDVARLRRGDFFGEMSLLTGESRSATVVACDDSRLLCVDRRAFGEVLKAQPDLARAMSETLAQRSASLRSRTSGSAALTPSTALETSHILGRLRELFRIH